MPATTPHGVSIPDAARLTGLPRKAFYRMVQARTIRFRRSAGRCSRVTLHPEDVQALANAAWEGQPVAASEAKP